VPSYIILNAALTNILKMAAKLYGTPFIYLLVTAGIVALYLSLNIYIPVGFILLVNAVPVK
jgi:hypothetical protein